MKYRLWYKEGIGEPHYKFFQSFTQHYIVGTFDSMLDMMLYIHQWNHFRAVWEFETL